MLCECLFIFLSPVYLSYVKEPQPTVLDSMVIWNLNLMTATAQAAMPVAPQLRTTLLNQTRWVAYTATCYMIHAIACVCAECVQREGCECGTIGANQINRVITQCCNCACGVTCSVLKKLAWCSQLFVYCRFSS